MGKPNRIVFLMTFVLLSAGCTRQSSLTEAERSYLDLVQQVRMPLEVDPDLRTQVMDRANFWVVHYSVYSIRSRGSTFLVTEQPSSSLQGGHGYRVEANDLDGVMTVEVIALAPDRFREGATVRDPLVEQMVGLYLRDGILPPNDRVGFEVGRR